MDSDHNELASEPSISNQDWNLLWGASPERSTFRGAPTAVEDTVLMDVHKPPNTKLFEQRTEDRRHPLPEHIQEVDPMFLTRCCILAAQVALPMVFQFILDFVQEHDQTSGNFEADEPQAMIRGGMFDETRFAEYQIKLFTFEGQLGLSLDVLDGFAPAVQGFWNELQQALKENEYTQPQDTDEDEDSDDDCDFLDSEDEDERDDIFNLEDAKYLNLHESPEIVHQWFQDLSNPNFMQQTLLLLAWNCQDQQNFQTVTGEKQAQQLFDTLIACMIATAADFCLPIARCASMLVSQLVDTHDINVTEEQFNVLVQTLAQWSITNHGDPESRLTSSQEVASILSYQMSKMAPLAVNWKDTLQRVYTQAPYDCVRENLSEVIRAY